MATPQETANAIWQKVNAPLKEVFSGSYDRWISALQPIRVDTGLTGSKLVLGVDNQFASQWIQDHYLPSITKAVSSAYGSHMTVELNIQPRDMPPSEPATRIVPSKARLDLGKLEKMGIQPDETFDTFIMSPENHFAYSVARARAESTEGGCLYFWGRPGVGKTHLTRALVSKRFHDNQPVEYVPCETLLNHFVAGIQNGRQLGDFRTKYRNVGVLAIDDFNFITGKPKFTEEVAHTVETLTRNGSLVVFAANRPPNEIFDTKADLGNETYTSSVRTLASHIEGGLVIEVAPPGREMRASVIRDRLAQTNTYVPDETITYLADHLKPDMRTIVGATRTLSAYVKEHPTQQPSPEKLRRLVEHLYVQRASKIEEVATAVAEGFGIKPEDLKSKTTRREISDPRLVAMYLCQYLPGVDDEKVAKYFGLNKTAVRYARTQIPGRVETDKGLADKVRELRGRFVSD